MQRIIKSARRVINGLLKDSLYIEQYSLVGGLGWVKREGERVYVTGGGYGLLKWRELNHQGKIVEREETQTSILHG